MCGWFDLPLSAVGRQQVHEVCESRWSPVSNPMRSIPARSFARGKRPPRSLGFGTYRCSCAVRCARSTGGELEGLPLVNVARDYPELMARNDA